MLMEFNEPKVDVSAGSVGLLIGQYLKKVLRSAWTTSQITLNYHG